MVRVFVARGELPRLRRGRKILVFDAADVLALKRRREGREK